VKIRAYIDNPGHWMAHCHILEHAEMGMMGEIYVTPDPNAPPLGPMSH
jgi:FtsP/CotA-like multicopper oxidase with cupredoxin domain